MISRETDWPHLQVVDTVDEALTLLREQVGKSGSARTPGD
jgi:hypothetical protein